VLLENAVPSTGTVVLGRDIVLLLAASLAVARLQVRPRPHPHPRHHPRPRRERVPINGINAQVRAGVGRTVVLVHLFVPITAFGIRSVSEGQLQCLLGFVWSLGKVVKVR